MAAKLFVYCVMILSRKTAKQTCGSKTNNRKNKNILNSLEAVIHKNNVMRPAIAKRLCTLVISKHYDFLDSFISNLNETFVGLQQQFANEQRLCARDEKWKVRNQLF